MKRRKFLKMITKGGAGLALVLIGYKTELKPEPGVAIERSVDRTIDGGDLGGYLVPEEYTDQILAAVRVAAVRERSVLKANWTTVDNPIGNSGITPGIAQPLGSSEFSEYLKGIGQQVG